MPDQTTKDGDVAREAVLTRLRQRHERLWQLARVIDRGQGEPRPLRPERGFAANGVPMRAEPIPRHAGDA